VTCPKLAKLGGGGVLTAGAAAAAGTRFSRRESWEGKPLITFKRESLMVVLWLFFYYEHYMIILLYTCMENIYGVDKYMFDYNGVRAADQRLNTSMCYTSTKTFLKS